MHHPTPTAARPHRRWIGALLTAGLLLGGASAVLAADPGIETVYVANGRNFPDALAGSVLAALEGAPVLLVERDVVPAPTVAELGRLQPERIVVLGGPAAVDDAVVDALEGYAQADTPDEVTRLSGADRFATAAAISELVPAQAADADTLDGLDSTDFVRVDDAPDLLYAVVADDGSLVSGRGATDGERLSEGRFVVRFDRDLTGCSRVAMAGNPGSGTNLGSIYGTELTDGDVGVFVATFALGEGVVDGTTDRPFHLQVVC